MLISKEICSSLTDNEILERSRENIDYFSCLYERYEYKLLRYIHRISSFTDEEAEDVLQESFIKIWRNMNAPDQDLKLSSWLYRIVHNETISQWRKKKSYGKDQILSLDENFNKNLSIDFDPEEDQEEKLLLTHKILDLLPLKYKEVLVLKFFEKKSYEEISDILKIPEGTVATRINRAKKAFIKIAGDKKANFNE